MSETKEELIKRSQESLRDGMRLLIKEANKIQGYMELKNLKIAHYLYDQDEIARKNWEIFTDEERILYLLKWNIEFIANDILGEGLEN